MGKKKKNRRARKDDCEKKFTVSARCRAVRAENKTTRKP